ncbi:MAG: DNA-3-methyladenine glycosylase 2 family protein [Patescibacteria group bacterium]
MDPRILRHFKKADPILYKVAINISKLEDLPNRRGEDYFIDLIDAIVSQQLSGKAAATILARFKALFKNGQITPQALLKLRDVDIRAAGMSYSKIKYVKDLAAKVHKKEIDLKKLDALPDEEVIEQLIMVKGIGRWTAEMFLIFTLARPDVFSHGDLGLNNAIKKIYKLKNHTTREVEKIVSKWSPYKSTASRILWHSLDNR